MNNNNVDILNLVHSLKDVLAQLDRYGFAMPAIKVEEAILALQQLEDQAANSNDIPKKISKH